jgi:hypothetical protein
VKAHPRTERRPDLLLAAAGKRGDVGAAMHRGRARLLGQNRELVLGPAAADEQPAAARAQAGVEVGQTLEQELRARTGGVAAA